MSATIPRKLVAAVAALGVGVSLSAGAAAATPHSAATTTTTLSGANGATSGALVPASKSVAAFWAKNAATARSVTVAARAASASSQTGAASTPQGRAGKVAGTTGTVSTSGAKATGNKSAYGSSGQPWLGNFWSAPATTTGKIFFQDHNGGNWVCSGSLVNSTAKDLVITAGHCVYGTAGGELPAGETWHRNWVFAPDYSYGYAPFGFWSARQLWTMTNYMNNGDEQDDIGAALLWANSSGTRAVNLLGGQGIAWNQSSTQFVYDLGYPAASPFNGQSLQYCTGTASYGFWTSLEMLPCNFTGGSSGGPWLMSFNGNWGYVNSVNDANGYWIYPGQMGGLYFGNNAGNLYNTVASL